MSAPRRSIDGRRIENPPLEIRVLGPLEVRRDGCPVPLPASKKTRALLAYVVAAAGPHARARLCELLWDGTDDPRAALRWSLSKLRPLFGGERDARLVADRDRVALDCRNARVDLIALRRELGSDPSRARIDALERAAAMFRGELLEDLDLPDCYRYHEWWSAERETIRTLRVAILSELVIRLGQTPDVALKHARAQLLIDPFSEAAHVRVIELLGRLGRAREALQQYDTCRRMLQDQLGAKPSAALERARTALTGGRGPHEIGMAVVRPSVLSRPIRPLFGREHEAAQIVAAVDAARAGHNRSVLLITGESGIGKTRLLEHCAAQIAAAGGAILRGRAYQAEMVRPYGPWIDALRSSAIAITDPLLRADLSPLLPELSTEPTVADRSRLFDAVVRLIARLAESCPVALLLDDTQWFDDASAGLLHFTARALTDSRVMIACAARSTEIDDNAPVLTVVRALAREEQLVELPLAPLPHAAMRDLVESLGTASDVDRVVADSDGNPLFAIEMARGSALPKGRASDIDHVIGDRLARLSDRARDLVPWAAAFGKNFAPDVLRLVSGQAPTELLGAMDELERRGVIRPSSVVAGSYDFTHDLIRRAAYRQLSEPRRRTVHLQIARAMRVVPDPDGALAGEIAHHAWAGGDDELAVQAAVAAGERALRLFAYTDAYAIADRALRDAMALPSDLRVRQQMKLLAIAVHASVGVPGARDLDSDLSRAILDAQGAGLASEAATGFYLLSFRHHAGGNYTAAHQDTLRAAEAAREADPATAARSLANTARCLAQLEREIPRAEGLLVEATALAAHAGVSEPKDIAWGFGLVRAHRGDYDEAVRFLESAHAIAGREQDHWAESQCLQRLALIELERGRPDAARRYLTELVAVTRKMGEGSEAPFAQALSVLTDSIVADDVDDSRIDQSIAELRAIDANALLARALTIAALLDLDHGRTERAKVRAGEAERAAKKVGAASDAVIALGLLIRVATLQGDNALAAKWSEDAAAYLTDPDAVSAYARRVFHTTARAS